MKIILIGFMGCGKSTIAKLLAYKLSLRLICMDKIILEKSGRKTVREIFDTDGETVFREMEIETAKQLVGTDNAVIDTGGGAVENGIIFHYLKNNNETIVIYLKTGFNRIFTRLLKDPYKRPLFQGKKQGYELWKLREPLYTRYADICINTDGFCPEEISEKIINILKQYDD